MTERYTGGMAPPQTAIICLAVGLAVTVGADVLTLSYARIGVMLLFGAQIWLEQRCARRLFLMSPVFLLALVGLVAFTLLPNAIYTALQPFHDHQPGLQTHCTRLFWQQGEGLILAFCAAGLVVHGILALIASSRTAPSISRNPDPRGGKARTAYGLSGTLGFMFLAATHTDLFGATATNLMRTGVAPIQAFLLLYLLHCALDRSRIGLVPVVLLIVFNLTVMVLAHGGKIPVLIGMAAGLYYIAHTRVSYTALNKAVLAFAVVLVIVMQFIHLVREPEYYGPSNEIAFTQKIGNIFLRKLLWRQAETGYCLSNVFAAHKDDRFELSNQTFWVKILIPRAVWPEKPDFSLGGRYATVYCGMEYVNNFHSASITLLGQPVIPRRCRRIAFAWGVSTRFSVRRRSGRCVGPGASTRCRFCLVTLVDRFRSRFRPLHGEHDKIWDLHAAVLTACDGPDMPALGKLRIAGAECLYDHQPTWRRFDAGMF